MGASLEAMLAFLLERSILQGLDPDHPVQSLSGVPGRLPPQLRPLPWAVYQTPCLLCLTLLARLKTAEGRGLTILVIVLSPEAPSTAPRSLRWSPDFCHPKTVPHRPLAELDRLWEVVMGQPP